MILALVVGSCDKDEVVTPAGIEPTLTSIQAQIFNGACASSTCHGTAAGSLTLTPGSSLSQMVNVRSVNDGDHAPQFFRVKPGSPDSSFLIVKLTSPSSRQGDLMPSGESQLTQEQINAIRTWIANGALNN